MKILQKLKSTAGFTMIELLIVIAIIGVLAVAILSAINPVEQLNKSRDTATRTDASELLSAIERFYVARDDYPWVVDNSSLDSADEMLIGSAPTGSADLTLNQLFSSSGALVASEELKQGAISRLSANPDLAIYKAGTINDNIHVCFIPQSNQFALEAADDCAASSNDNSLFCLDSLEKKYVCIPGHDW